jgi:hypothetical protein
VRRDSLDFGVVHRSTHADPIDSLLIPADAARAYGIAPRFIFGVPDCPVAAGFFGLLLA